ncbi:MAG: hypothetical protein JST54_20345, partial [Deltaproteobacteria bacterium]|nr:hypothetical protein [Deltaproteobacteria bacterium]
MARAKLGEILMQRGVIDAALLKRALGEQTRFVSQKFKLGQLLVDMKACSWEQVAEALAEQQSVPYANLEGLEDGIVKLVPLEVCEKWQAVVIGRDPGPPEQVSVAFADPADLVAVDALRLRVGRRLKVFIAAPNRIKATLDRVFRGTTGLEPTHPSVSLDDDFFGDAPTNLAVEHFDAGSLNLPDQGASAVAVVESGSSGISLGEEGFDSLFSATPTASESRAPRGNTPPPGVLSMADMVPGMSAPEPAEDPLASLGLDMPPPPPPPPPPRAHARPPTPGPRIPVTLFPDKRPPKEHPAPPPPVPAAQKPTLVLTSDALFGKGAEGEGLEEGSADLTGEVLAGEVVEDGPTAPPLPSEPTASDLFASSFDASDHPDPMHPAHAPVPNAKDLFGSHFEAEATVDLHQEDAAPKAEAKPEPGADPTPLGEELFDIVDDASEGATPLAASPPLPAPAPKLAPIQDPLAPEIDIPKLDLGDLPLDEPPKPEPVKVEAPKPEPVKVEAPKVELPRPPTPKPELPKVEAPKPEPVKVEAPKVE